MRHFYLLAVLFLISAGAFAQSNGDYRSVQSGDWNDAASWQVFDGSWVGASTSPDNTDNLITIRNSHEITVTANVTVDQTLIENGGIVTVDAGVTLTLGNGAGNDINVAVGGEFNLNGIVNTGSGISGNTNRFRVFGTLNNNGSFSSVTAVKLIFEAGSHYYHLFNGTASHSIPLATWNSTSTVHIVGYTSGTITPSGLGQSFSNFIWDCPDQSDYLDLGGAPSSITGNFVINDTGGGGFYWNQGSGVNTSFNIGGDFLMAGGVVGFIGSTGSTGTLQIAGNLEITGGYLQIAEDVDATVDIASDLLLSGGAQLEFASLGATTTIDLIGDFQQTGGDIFISDGLGNLNFVGTAQNYESSVAPAGALNYDVAIGTTVTLAGASSNFLGGAGTFDLRGTIELGSTSAAGALQNSTTAGNVRVSGVRTYHSGAVIVYHGTAAQFIGTGHPSNAGVKTTIDNSSGVTLAADVTINGELELLSGNLSLSSRTLTINGNFIPTSGSLALSSTSSIVVGGSGTFTTLPLTGSSTLNNLTINRSGITVALDRDLTIDGTFTHTLGNLDFSDDDFTINGNYANAGGQFLFNSASTLTVRGSGTVNALPYGSTTIGSFTLNNTNGASSSNPITIANTITLQNGAYTGTGAITMANGSTFVRGDGSTTQAINSSGSYNLIYNGSGTVTPGNELPTSTTALNDLTAGTSVTLNRNITVNGTLTLSNGTFDAGTFTVTLEGNVVSNASVDFDDATLIFGGNTTISGTIDLNLDDFTVSTGSTLNLGTGTMINVSGNITNNGTISGGTSTVTFDGVTVIDGGGTASPKGSFHNIEISGSLSVDCALCVYPTNPYAIFVSGNFIVQPGGVFIANESTVQLNGVSQSMAMDGQSFFDLSLQGTGTVTLSEELDVLQDLTIGSTATLSTGVGNETIYLGDDFIINGTFTPNFGTVIFNGTAGQAISGSATTINFYNIDLDKPATTNFSIESNCNLQNAFTFTSTEAYNVDFDGLSSTTAKMTLISDFATGRTGHIMNIPDAITLSGNIITQRYMEPSPDGARIYRYIASPVQGATVAMLQDDFPVTGTFTGRSTCSAFAANARNMYYYNEAVTGSSANGYVGFPTSTNTEAMTSGRGYAVQMCDGVSVINWEVSGTVRRGTAALPATMSVNYTNSGLPNDDGMNLVGNPFPAPIDWGNENNATTPAGWTKTNITNSFWVRHNKENTLAVYNGDTGLGTNGAIRYIAIGQAFWVQAIGSGPSLTALESVKVSEQPEYLREKALPEVLRITLVAENLGDEIILHFNDRAEDGPNSFGDSRKFLNEKINLSSFAQGDSTIQLAINSMSPFTCVKPVGLRISDVDPGTYALSFAGFSTFENTSIVLVDLYAGTTTTISEGTAYAFDVTADSASFGASRFQVYFNKGETIRAVTASEDLICASEALNITVENPQAGLTYFVTLADGSIVSAKVEAETSSSLVIPVNLVNGHYTININAEQPGCSAIPVAKLDDINIIAVPQVDEIQSNSSCGVGQVTFNVETVGEATGFNWYAESGELPVAQTQEGEWTTPSLDQSMVYFVAPVNAMGCEGQRQEIRAEVKPLPVITIANSGSHLHASGGAYQYIWYLDGEEIAGNVSSIEITEPGEYSVSATANGCTAALSAKVSFEELGDQRIQLSPNPATSFAKLKVYSSAPELSIKVLSSTGRHVFSLTPEKTAENLFEANIDVSSFPGGYYILMVSEEGVIHHRRFIKQ